MNSLAVFLIIVSAFMHTYWNYVLKRSINKGADPVLLLWLSDIFAILIYLPAFIFFAAASALTSFGILLAAISGLFMAVYVYFLSESYKFGDLSEVYPISKTTPLFTLLIGILILSEAVSIAAVAGIFLILGGGYLLHMKSLRFEDLMKPISSMRDKASLFALITAVISAFYGLSSKLGVAEMNPFAFVYLAYVFLVLFYSPLPASRRAGIMKQIKRFRGSIVRIGVSDMLGYSLIVFALLLSKLSYVFALRQMSILLCVIVGVYELREGYGRIRIAASVIIIAGIVLISLF
jgi:uncharacterized membrane protein